MSNYTKFRVEAQHDHRYFRVLVKGWFGWKRGFVWTDYFSIYYTTEQEALDAIEGYKNRFIEVN